MTNQREKLPALPSADDCIVHIYPSDLERMESNETTAGVYSVAVGCPEERSIPLYTADQMRDYAIVAISAAPASQNAQQAPDKDAERLLDAIAENYWKLDPFSMPTGADDADVGWRIVQYHMDKPHERTVAEVYRDDPRAAIRAAIIEGSKQS